MSGPAYMAFYPADYVAATRHLSTLERGIYTDLIWHYWIKGSLPKDDRTLARIASLSEREWLKHKDVIAEFFDADWKHARIEKELEKARTKSVARAECGALGGAAKALKNKDAKLAKARVLPQQNSGERLPSSSEPEQERKTDATHPNARELEAEFLARFWPRYPEKVGRPKALTSYAKARRKATEQEILDGLDRYIASKDPDRSWCHPTTWLNQERWTDELASPAPARASSNQQGGSRIDTLAAAVRARIARRHDDGRDDEGGDLFGGPSEDVRAGREDDVDRVEDEGRQAAGQANGRGEYNGRLPAFVHARAEWSDDTGHGTTVVSIRDGARGGPDMVGRGGGTTLDIRPNGQCEMGADSPRIAARL